MPGFLKGERTFPTLWWPDKVMSSAIKRLTFSFCAPIRDNSLKIAELC